MEEEKGSISKQSLVIMLDRCLASELLIDKSLELVFENIFDEDMQNHKSGFKTLQVIFANDKNRKELIRFYKKIKNMLFEGLFQPRSE